MTFPFIGGSSNIDKDLAHYVTYMCAKNEVDPSNGLGGVREHTDIQTYMVREIRRRIEIKSEVLIIPANIV